MSHSLTVRLPPIALVVLLWFSIPISSQTIPLERIEGPVCVVRDSITGASLPLAPDRSQYNLVVSDGLAHLELTQRYVADVPNVSDIVYVFPLPHEGSVHAMSFQYLDKVYHAAIREKEEAQSIYDSLVSQGKNAALLLQQKPNVFQQRLANIAFGDTAYIQIELSMPLKYDDNTFELALPTTVAARFGGASSLTTPGDFWNPAPDRLGQSLGISILLETGYPVQKIHSPTHPMTVSQLGEARERLAAGGFIPEAMELTNPEGRALFLENSETYPNRDFVLRFERAATARDFSLTSQWDASRDEGYFALQLFPDAEDLGGDRVDLEVLFLVDISGSQGGWPLATEKALVENMLGRLQPRDRFTVAAFSTSTQWAFGPNQVVAATAANVQRGLAFTQGLRAGGGTYLLDAVKAVLATPLEADRQRIFVFLTDGFIGNEEAIFSAIGSHPSEPTVFTFGAGNNLNRYFLERTAQVGGGFATELTQGDNVVGAVDNAWGKIESPQMRNVTVDMPGATNIVRLGSPHLFAGSPLLLCGRYASGGTQHVRLQGYVAGQPVTLSKTLSLEGTEGLDRKLPQIWARRKIAALMLEQGASDSSKDSIIAVSVNYQVLTRYTAFLAHEPQGFAPEEDLGNRLGSTGLYDVRAFESLFVLEIQHGLLTLSLPEAMKLKAVEIYDLSGRLVYSDSPRGSRWSWDGSLGNGSRLKSGRYLIRFQTGRGSVSRLFLWNGL